ncbi:T9SS type A sorting domain-containing protein [Flavobacterium sp.]|jgi:endoglucanase|uniref:T9SS type A sorting domain-containing protein n=1 Tax=Flavobacterium sp. TaxID=239 RepID=UPI0037BEC2D5
MKKITLFVFLAACSISQAQEFPLNFTNSNQLFEGFGGATTSLVPDPTASTNQVLRVVGNGEFYDTAQLNLLTNYINLADNANNTITFRVKPEADYGTRTHLLKFQSPGTGVGATQTELTFDTSGTAWTTITLDFPAGLSSYKLMVLFPDFGNAFVGTYLFDDFAGATNIAPPAPVAGPLTNSPVPPNRLASEVVSIYSDAYTSISPMVFDAGWCGSSSVEQTTAGGVGNNVTYYKGNPCQGITFQSAVQNFTGLTNLHVDLFIASGTNLIGKVFNLKIVPVTGAVTEFNIDLNALSPAPVPGTWYSYDKVISYSGPTNNIHEFGVTSNLNNIVWYDNLYFHKNTTMSSDSFEASKVKLYPNPTSNVLNIESGGTIQTISVYNVLGQEVINKALNSTSTALDVSSLNSGIYVVKTVVDGVTSSTKFIKQ